MTTLSFIICLPFKDAVTQQSKYMETLGLPNILQQRTTQQPEEQSSEQQEEALISQNCGRKIVFDNLDYRQKVHYMTEKHQNIDRHVVSIMATENRIPGYHLSDQTPKNGVAEIDVGQCLPNQNDNIRQRNDYVVLVERIIVEHLHGLNLGHNLVTAHIPHRYIDEVKRKTETVCIIG